MSASEPVTAHFTSEQLAAFLEQLEREAGSDAARMRAEAHACPPTRALRYEARRPDWVEPATSLANVLPTSIGVPRWRSGVRSVVASASRDEPSEVSHARLLHGPTSDEDEEDTGPRPFMRSARNAWFVVSALVVLACGVGWYARTPVRHDPKIEPRRVAQAPAALVEDEPHRADSSAKLERVQAVPPAKVATRTKQAPRAMPHALVNKREAVDRLFAGRTRAALESYHAWLSTTSDDARSESVVRVMQLLDRELEACANLMGAPCDL